MLDYVFYIKPGIESQASSVLGYIYLACHLEKANFV